MSAFVSVEVRGDECFVIGHDLSPTGIYRETGDYLRLRASTDDESLGAAVLEILASQTAVQDDADHQSIAQHELKIRSYGAYLDGALAVYVEPANASGLRVTPTLNKGRRGGFVEMRQGHIELPIGDAVDLGCAIRRGLQASA